MTTLRLHDRTMAAASAIEAEVMRVAARGIDALVHAGRSLADVLKPFRLRAPPSPAEWGAAMASALLGLATPLAAYMAFDRAIVAADASAGARLLTACMTAALAAAVVDTALRMLRATAADRLARSRQAIIAAREAAQLVLAPMPDDAGEGAPHRVAQLEAHAAFDDLEAGVLRRAVLDAPAILVSLAAVAWLGGWVVLAPLSLVLAMTALFAGDGRLPAQLLRARESHDARSDDFIAECAVNMHAIKAGALEPFMSRRMESLLASGRQLERRLLDTGLRADDMRPLIEAASVVAVGAVGGLLALNGQMHVGALMACALLAVAIVRPATRIAAAAQQVRYLRLDRLPQPDAPGRSMNAQAVPDGVFDVDATFDDRLPVVRFKARPGAIIAVTARDGDLMSRAMRLFAGLEAPRTGIVTFAGENVRVFRLQHPGALALVSQRATLFAGTVLENLTLFGHGATEAEALAACNVLGLRREIDRLPQKLDTPVGRGAADCISDSLAHRLCIARAIALRPRVLLLDEPQARLDANADRALVSGLGTLRGRMTIIISTSRPSYLSLADQVFTLDRDAFGAAAAARTESMR